MVRAGTINEITFYARPGAILVIIWGFGRSKNVGFTSCHNTIYIKVMLY